jgi:hypothetical protein
MSQKKEKSVITHISVYKKGDETDCNNYQGTSVLSASYRML